MATRILTKNAVENTNIDGAREIHFSAGMKSGIVKGALNEGRLFASSSNVIALDTCELILSGHRIVVDEPITISFSSPPANPTRYSLIAQIVVASSVPTFSVFAQVPTTLVQNNLFSTSAGDGTYQLEIGKFTLSTSLSVIDIVRTCDLITGGGEAISDIVFNATATQLSAGTPPTANVDYNENTGEFDMTLGIPVGSGTNVQVNGVTQATWDATQAIQGYAQPLVLTSTSIDLNNSTLTTLAQYIELFDENFPKIYRAGIGYNQTSNLRTLLTDPFNQTETYAFIEPDVHGANLNYKVWKVTAVARFSGKLAVGYLKKWFDASQNPSVAGYSWTGWQTIS